MKRYLLFYFLFAFYQGLFAQWLDLPYSVDLVNPQKNFQLKDFSNYFSEFDIDNDGELEFITFEPYTIRFFEKDFSIIDAINVEQQTDFFRYIAPITSANKNYVLLNVVKNYRGEIWLVNIKEDNSVFKKIIYSFPSGNKSPYFGMNNFQINNDLALLYISINYPRKHDYKRLVAMDPRNFKIKWTKFTADFVHSFFTIDSSPNAFYYTTLAYFNQVYFSNNTYYDTNEETHTIFIDTSFTDIIYPQPDINAPDFSCDTASYLVKMDLDGNTIFRKQTGTRYQHLALVDNSNKDFTLLYLDNRSTNIDTLFTLNKKNDELKAVKNSRISLFHPSFTQPYDGAYICSFPGKVQKFNIENDSTVLLVEKTFDDEFLGRFVGDYYVGTTSNNKYQIYDKNFNLLASFDLKGVKGNFKWSNILNSLVFKTKDDAFQVKLTKKSFFQRINSQTMSFLTYSAIIATFVILAFWIVTMRISKKRIIEQNAQLIKQQKELELATSQLIRTEKLATLGTIAAGFAHQLNSPIGAILNSAQRLNKKYQDENIDLILRSVNFCKSIVGKFLIASRPDKDDKATCSHFNTVWNDWFVLYKSEFMSKKIRINVEAVDTDVKIKIKNSELIEILNNILFNARDSVLEANRNEKFINIRTKVENERFVITVEDSGTGFDNKIINSIFEPFVTTKPMGAGTGLGMWITKKIIDEHRGEIKIANGNTGAIIEIFLPIC